MQNRLFAIPGAQPVVWVICGEFEEGSDRKKIYMYFILPSRIPFLTDNGPF